MRTLTLSLLLFGASAFAATDVPPLGVTEGPLAATRLLNEAAAAAVSGQKRGLRPPGVVRQTGFAIANFEKDRFTSSFLGELRVLSVEGRRYQRRLAGRLEGLGFGTEKSALDLAYSLAAIEARLRIETALGVAERGLESPSKARRVSPARRVAKARRMLALANKTAPLAARYSRLRRAALLLRGALVDLSDPVSGQSQTWVVSDLSVAGAGQGADLTGDGNPNNALGGALALVPDVDLDAAFAEALAGDSLPIIQMFGFESFDTDPLVWAGLLTGIDRDGDPTDNFSGSESFDASESLDSRDGYAILRAATGFGPGATYRVVASGDGFDLAGFELASQSLIAIEGTAGPDSNVGFIGLGIPTDVVVDLIGEQVALNPFLVAAIRALADVDVDGNGTKDAISLSLAFDSVSCTLQ
jgi:hypothetical protein